MIKHLLFLLSVFIAPAAFAAEMVNVEYIHKAIESRWDITVPYNPALGNPRVAANMKYLLTAVDRANEIIGSDAPKYGTGEFATLAAADTVATQDAVNRLIADAVQPKFTITTTPDTTSFNFDMSARGRFVIDWGDGNRDVIVRKDTNAATYSHTYKTAGEYKIGLSGRGTGYNDADYHLNPTPVITFRYNENIAAIAGSLGAIFGTIGDGSSMWQQPVFRNALRECKNLNSEIPADLFKGVHGAPRDWMFAGTFQGSGFIGSIPENLFSGISGPPVYAVFNNTFVNTKLTGSIPEKLFAGIRGAPAAYMFAGTFDYTSGLTGAIPAKLFAGISGAPAIYMYHATFRDNTGITGEIPENLFGNISGDAADYMFAYTFVGCTGITGSSARMNGKYLYDIWPDAPEFTSFQCYHQLTQLSDYESIPANWK